MPVIFTHPRYEKKILNQDDILSIIAREKEFLYHPHYWCEENDKILESLKDLICTLAEKDPIIKGYNEEYIYVER